MKFLSDPSALVERLGTSVPAETACSLLGSKRVVHAKLFAGSYTSVFVASLRKQYRKGNVYVFVPDKEVAERRATDLISMLGAENLCYYSDTEQYLYASMENLDEQLVSRTGALQVIVASDTLAVVSTAADALLSVPKPDQFRQNLVTIKAGEQLAFDQLIDVAVLNGFNRKDYVESVGDIAVRGGIVDIFAPGQSNPVRVEFFGNEVESIREFDPLSQRSIRSLDKVEILSHMFHSDDDTGGDTLFSYLADDDLVVILSPEQIESNLGPEQLEQWNKHIAPRRRIVINALTGAPDIAEKSQHQTIQRTTMASMLGELRRLAAQHYSIVLCADGNAQAERLNDLIDSAVDQLPDDEDPSMASIEATLRRLRISTVAISEGFLCQDRHIAIFAEHQLFGRRQATRKRSKSRATQAFTVRELQSLRRGDLVVHSDHGVAIFDGLETITVGGSQQECVRLIFANSDKMFVHLNYINRLQRYSAEEGAPPKLSRLGTKDWSQKKAATKKQLKDIARELIALYARRKSQPGFAFPADSVWQKELEASFMYEDTPDQAQATQEVKRDMESATPMDRLVCGDVGFGKTEVAIRAAFKAVQAGKQVAVLVPTTILAEQHYSSFHDRLHHYAVTVESLSRFKSTAQQTAILNKLKAGKVDILIGTHRILSKDIEFRNLGLLIIDEEQRFGVASKEKLRAHKASIDTLTLTATPIPRTLNFSLMGARDISVIATPPRNRLPIHTEVITWDDELIAKGITDELRRGGQIFFVNNRIDNLEEIADKLREMVPDLRVLIAHGGMEGKQLERIMNNFMERRADVLIATKIIESGIDIPNVNTIFINRADTFGLAELYQIRGRVGRSTIQAYSYLIAPPATSLTRRSLQRLLAIEEFTDLGSGMNLAMRDLEIRGAGNLLGAEQSGFIADMGFEMYQRILDEAVQELRDEEFKDLFSNEQNTRRPSGKREKVLVVNEDVAIDIHGSAIIPKQYIPNDIERYDVYKRLYRAKTLDESEAIFAEMRDRYGPLPQEVEGLREVVALRIGAMPLGVESVSMKNGWLELVFPSNENTRFYERAFQPLVSAVASMTGAKIASKGKQASARFPVHGIDEALALLSDLLESTTSADVPAEAV